MLIDCAYFTKGSRHILNATLGTLGNGTFPNANAVEVNEAIESYISEHQEEYLVSVFGYDFGQKVNSYLICIEEDESPKHIDSFDVLCEHLRDSFADYVFFHILRDVNTQSTITGLVRLKSVNEYVAPIRRQVNVWNAMVNKHRLLAKWCMSSDCPISGITISADMLEKINVLNL